MQLADLTTPLSLDDVRLAIYNVLAATGVTTTNWRPGAVVRTIITACAVVISSLSFLISLLARAGWLALSSGDWLTLVARYVYGVERIEATFAAGAVTLVNSGGANYNIDPEDLEVYNPITGAVYRNTSAIVLNGGTTVTDVPIRAVEQGAASTSFAGEITGLQSTLDEVSCTNPQAVVGADAESDQSLRLRCTDKLGSLGANGPKDAYGYAARSAVRSDGSSIGVTRVSVERLPGGVLNVYVANLSGAVPGTEDDPSTDLGAVSDAIQTKAGPLGITVNTFTVSTVTLDVEYQVWLYNTTSMSRDDVAAACLAKLQEFINGQPIGGNVISPDTGKIYKTALESAIGSAEDTAGARLPFFRVELLSPTTNFAVPANAVAVLGSILSSIVIAPSTGV